MVGLRVFDVGALIVWLTDLAETAGVPDVIECASQMADRHLVLCAMLRQMDVAALAETSPATPADLYRVLAAQEVLDRRETLTNGIDHRHRVVRRAHEKRQRRVRDGRGAAV